MKELLKKTIQNVYAISEDEWNYFSEYWQPFSAKRKEIITYPNTQEKYLYFVVDGIQRVYYLDEQDREATLVFTYSPSFGGVLDSLMLEQPSKYYYETLTSSQFLRISHTHLLDCTKKHPNIEFFINKGITQALSGLLERLVELQSFSSEEKFKKLLQRSPHIIQLVAHKYLANYLGIDVSSFSRLFNSIKI
ncbi:cyclic nucleotide-binding protein [bacterium 336/3]|nr:cyclic nucleotide-binding protein [bacterium 336/3]